MVCVIIKYYFCFNLIINQYRANNMVFLIEVLIIKNLPFVTLITMEKYIIEN